MYALELELNVELVFGAAPLKGAYIDQRISLIMPVEINAQKGVNNQLQSLELILLVRLLFLERRLEITARRFHLLQRR